MFLLMSYEMNNEILYLYNAFADTYSLIVPQDSDTYITDRCFYKGYLRHFDCNPGQQGVAGWILIQEAQCSQAELHSD